MASFVVFSIIACGAVGLWGLLTHDPDLWFMVKGGVVNAFGLVASLYAVGYGLAYGASFGGGWWLLALIGGGFGWVCAYNLWDFFSGQERRRFVDQLSKELRGSEAEAAPDPTPGDGAADDAPAADPALDRQHPRGRRLRIHTRSPQAHAK